LQGHSFSYGCYGFGRTTFQPIKWQSIIQSVNLCKLGPRFKLTCLEYASKWLPINRHALKKYPGYLRLSTNHLDLYFPSNHLGKLRLFIDRFKSRGSRNGHSCTTLKRKTLLFIKSVNHTQLSLRQICRHNY